MTVIPLQRGRRAAPTPKTRPHAGSEAFAGLFKASDGVELYFEDSGGNGPALFFIYGLGCSIKHWKYPLAHFAAEGKHRRIWMDFRGHGRSEAPIPGTRLTVDLILRDVRELCAFRGIGKATFLGQSMGGSLGLTLASENPELVAGLILLASPGRDPSLAFPLPAVTRRIWRLLIDVNRKAPFALRLGYAAALPYIKNPLAHVALREYIRSAGFNTKLSKTEDIDEYIGEIFAINPTLFYDMAEGVSTFDVATLARPVDVPSLILAGARDTVVPLAESRRLAGYLPRGELAVIPHGSHCPHFDDPTLVNALMDAFLKRNGL